MKKPLLTLLILTIAPLFLQAQDALVVSGEEATGSGGTTSYSVGQIVHTTNSSASGIVFQGVQLPFEIFDEGSLAVEDIFDIQLGIKVYPNPTLSKLSLTVNRNSNNNLQYQLYDLNGRLLFKEKVRDQETTIPMDDYPSATYSLVILSNNNPIKSFKIIKK